MDKLWNDVMVLIDKQSTANSQSAKFRQYFISYTYAVAASNTVYPSHHAVATADCPRRLRASHVVSIGKPACIYLLIWQMSVYPRGVKIWRRD
jgi:hypothetical protein